MAQRKLTAKQLQQAYSKLTGEDVDLVADDNAETAYNEDEILSLVDANRSPIIEQKLRGVLEGEINGKVSGKITAAHKKTLIELTGIPAAEIEGKDGKEATRLAVQHYAKSLGTDKDTAAQQLQEVMSNHAKELEAVKGTLTAKEQEFQQKIASFGIKNVLGQLYANAKGIDPKAKKDILQSDFEQYLHGNFTVKLTEDGKDIVLYEKNNPNNLALNDARSQQVKLADIQKQYHVDRMQWNEDNRAVNPAEAIAKPKDHFVKGADGNMMSPNQQAESNLMEYLGIPA